MQVRDVVVLAIAGALTVACTSTQPSVQSSPSNSPAAASASAKPLVPPTVLVWSFGGYDAETTTRLLRVLGPTATSVATGSVGVASGVPAYPEIPVEAIAVDPQPFSAAMGDAALAPSLADGAVLSSTESRLRHVRAGETLRLSAGTTVLVTAVVPDVDIGGYEMAVDRARGRSMGVAHTGYLLVAAAPSLSRVSAQVQSVLGSRVVRVRRAGVRPFLRAADDVLPQALVKAQFGEFELRRTNAGFILDPAWVRRHIATRTVPILGSITCNVALLRDLSAVMTDLTHHGLASLIDVADFHANGGCFSARPVRGGADQISRHTWGAAIDINVAANPLNGSSHQDPRLIAAFERHHFTWGGGWLRPDPQHFEWVGDVPAYTETLR